MNNMNTAAVVPWTFQGSNVRTVTLNGEIFWVAKDVCECFGDTNHIRSISRVDDDDKILLPVTDSMGRSQNATTVNESGLWTLLLNFQPEKATKDGVNDVSPHTQQRIEKLKRFKKWVTSEVLPQIRKTGSYSLPSDPVDQVLLLATKLTETAMLVKQEREKNLQLSHVIQEQKPKVEAYQAFMDADGNCSLEETAKAIGMGRNRMTDKLRDKQIFYKKFANGENHVYQEFIDRGYFKVKLKTVDKGHGLSVPYPMIFTTPKGIEWLKMKVFSQSVAL